MASAYAWFYRSQYGGPGHWRAMGPEKTLTVIKHLKNRKVKKMPIGEVFCPATIASRYEYLVVRVALPETLLEEIKHV